MKTPRKITLVDTYLTDLAGTRRHLNERIAATRKARSFVLLLRERVKGDIPSDWIDSDASSVGVRKLPVVTLNLYMDGLDGLKNDPKLTPVLEAFMDSDAQSTTDFPSCMNRDYLFKYHAPVPGVDVHVKVVAYVRADSETCRKVPISVKTRVVDESVYELICD